MPLVDGNDLVEYLGPDASFDGAMADKRLAGVLAAARDYVNRPLTVETFTEERYPASAWRGRRLFLRNTPVVSVDAVVLDGRTALTEDTHYLVESWGLDDAWQPTKFATVTYDAGLSGEASDTVAHIVLAAAARLVSVGADGLDGVDSASAEGYSVTVRHASTFTDDELKVLRKFRRRVAR